MISKTSLEDTETATRMTVEGMRMVPITTQVCILMAIIAHTIIASYTVVVQLITTEQAGMFHDPHLLNRIQLRVSFAFYDDL
jgi:hypothetical protein